ncbi:MAG TPA: efflux RND transporter permease subunit, partial [Sphingomonadales bacterium]|nr:efflux RND transporter permease subunit [Sphingomonadales bacterium]
MKLTRHSLKNPPIVAVVCAMIALLGIVTLFKLPVQLLPNVEKPYITVFTIWRGAAPNEIESEITDQVEEVLQGIPGLEEMVSNSSAGFSFINLRFSLESDQTLNLVEVISRMNRLKPLPADADPPQVFLGNFGDDSEALMWFFVQITPGTETAPTALYEYFDNVIIPQFEAIPGVTGSNFYSTFGAGEQLQIIIDPYKVASLGIDLTDVALRAGRSLDVSGGFLDVGRHKYTLRFRGKFDAANLENLVVGFVNDQPIYLSEVARVRIGPGRPDGLIYQNGQPAFALQLLKDKNTNVLATLKQVKAKADELNASVLKDAGLRMQRSYDPSVFINRAISLLSGNLGLGLLFAMGILWAFLREKKATAIITLAVPISLMTTIVVMGFLGRSINVITLAGLAFATGMIMDAAIVVMENIVRLREKGLSKEEASDQGTSQVWGALLASTATTVIIFIPVMFLSDVEGQLFTDLALTIALSVTISLIAAVTILPTVAVKWFKQAPPKQAHAAFWDRFADQLMALTNTPGKRLGWIAGLLAVPTALTFLLLPTMDYLPTLKDDRVDAFFLAPPGITHETLDSEIAQPLNARIAPYLAGEKEPAILNYYFFAFGTAFVGMGARAQDPDKVDELEALMRDELTQDFPDTMVFVQRANLFGGFS